MKVFFICLAVGFLAQLIDGTLGMAYGVSCSTFLRTFGVSSAVSSAGASLSSVTVVSVSGVVATSSPPDANAVTEKLVTQSTTSIKESILFKLFLTIFFLRFKGFG